MEKKNVLGDIAYCQAVVDTWPGFEHSKLLDLQKDIIDGAKAYTIDEIVNLRPSGNVIGSLLNKKNELVFWIEKWAHKITVGGSGSGKTTRDMASQLLVNILSGVSSIIIDPKSEHYKRTAQQVVEHGGVVKLLNMRDPAHSEVINPLVNVANIIASIADVGKDAHIRKISKLKYIYCYDGEEYSSVEELENVFTHQINRKIKEAKKEVKDIIAKLWPVESQKDPYWEHTAWRMLEGIIYGLCMDQLSHNPDERVSVAQINFNNVNQIYAKFELNRRGIDDHSFFSRRGDDSWVYGVVKNLYFQQSEQTLRNQMGFTDEAFAKYDIPSFMELTLDTSISLKEFVNQFMVIYIDFDEMDVNSMRFLSFLISYFLRELKNMADNYDNGALPKTINVIIDEFATLNKMDDVRSGFAYLRSRNIFLHIALQSYSQLFSVYGEKDAQSIIENCNTQIFLGSNDFTTIQQFSRDFGKRAVVMPFSRIQEGFVDIRELPVLTCSDLTYMDKDTVYIKRNGHYPLRGEFLKCYEHPEFGIVKSLPGSYSNPIKNSRSERIYDIERLSRTDDDDDDDDDLF